MAESALDKLKRLRAEQKAKAPALPVQEEAKTEPAKEPEKEPVAEPVKEPEKAVEKPAEKVETKQELSAVDQLKAKLAKLRGESAEVRQEAEAVRPDVIPEDKTAEPEKEPEAVEPEAAEPVTETAVAEEEPLAVTQGVLEETQEERVQPIAHVSKEGTIIVHRMYKTGGNVVEDVNTSEQIQVGVFQQPTAQVSVERAMTIQPRQYESIKMGVFVSVPCYLEEIDLALDYAAKLSEERLIAEMDQIKRDTDG